MSEIKSPEDIALYTYIPHWVSTRVVHNIGIVSEAYGEEDGSDHAEGAMKKLQARAHLMGGTAVLGVTLHFLHGHCRATGTVVKILT